MTDFRISNQANPSSGGPTVSYNGAFDILANLGAGNETMIVSLRPDQLDKDLTMRFMSDQQVGRTKDGDFFMIGYGASFFSIENQVLRFSNMSNGNIGLFVYDSTKYIDPTYANINTNYSSSNPLLPFLYYSFPKLNIAGRPGRINIDLYPMLKLMMQEYFYQSYFQYLASVTGFTVLAGTAKINSRASFDDFKAMMLLTATGVNSFPKNSIFSFNVMFKTLNILFSGDIDSMGKVWDGSTFTIQLIQLPSTPMSQRKADLRVGYFGVLQTIKNQTRQELTHEYILKLNLSTTEKFKVYIDPSIQSDYYQTCQEVIDDYNSVFNGCGYTDPLELVTSDMNTWPSDYDKHDIRFSGITAVDDENPFTGIGQVTADFRSGEILQFWAGINMGAVQLSASEADITDFFSVTMSKTHGGRALCAMANPMAYIVFPLPPPSDPAMQARFKYVICHELGHCVGLRHNFGGSYENNSSIMDYPSLYDLNGPETEITFSPMTTLGVYDAYALTYGYQVLPAGDPTVYLDNMANGYAYNAPPGPPANPLFVTDEDYIAGNDPRGSQHDPAGTDVDRARKLYRINELIRQAFLTAFENGYMSLDAYSVYWLNNWVLTITRVYPTLTQYFGASEPTQDKAVFLYVDPAIQFTAMDSFLSLTDDAHFMITVGNEQFYLRSYNRIFNTVFPLSLQSGGNLDIQSRRANIGSVRADEYVKVFFRNVFSLQTIRRMANTSEYGPANFLDYLFRLMMSPGSGDVGMLPIDLGGPIVPLRELFEWGYIDFNPTYMENMGLFPELNAIFLGSLITDSQLGFIVDTATASLPLRQRREAALTAIYGSYVSGQLTPYGNTIVADDIIFFTSQLFSFYQSDQFAAATSAVPLGIETIGHISACLNTCSLILGNLVNGMLTPAIAQEPSLVNRMSQRQQHSQTLVTPQQLASSFVSRQIDVSGYSGLTTNQAAEQFRADLKTAFKLNLRGLEPYTPPTLPTIIRRY